MKKLAKVLITLILLLNTILIYFFDNSYDFFGIIDFEDFLSIFNITMSGFLMILTKGLKSSKKGFKKWIVFLVFMCFLSSLQSYLLFDQGILSGLFAQKELISMALLYFPISRIINNNILEKEKLNKMIDKFAIIQLILFITQYILSSEVTFLSVYTAERYGEIRYYFNPILLDLFLIRKLNLFVNGEKKDKGKSAIYIALVLFDVMVVQKYRLTSLGLIIIIIFGLLLSKTKLLNKIKYLIIGSGFSIFMLNTRIVQDLIMEVTTKSKTYTYSIREMGRKLYLETVSKHPILGGGYPKSESALIASGAYNKIYLSDNGIFAFMYLYGIVGLVWFATLWIKLLKNGYRILKQNSNIVYLLFPLFFVITCINELHWYWHHGFIIFILFLILFEKEMTEIEK